MIALGGRGAVAETQSGEDMMPREKREEPRIAVGNAFPALKELLLDVEEHYVDFSDL